MKACSRHYFAVPPQFLILTHWPKHRQFLNAPFDFSDIQPIIPVSMRTLSLYLHPLSWCEVISIGHFSPDPVASVSVKLNHPTTTYLTAKLVSISENNALCEEIQSSTFVKGVGESEYSIQAVLPASGTFYLCIYLHDTLANSKLDNFCLSYVINSKVEAKTVGFPQVYSIPAKAFDFKFLYWSTSKKSYDCVHKNGVFSFIFKTKSKLLFDHGVLEGRITDPNVVDPEYRQNYNTLIIQNKKNLCKLLAVFPSGGWWTVYLSATKANGEEAVLGYTSLFLHHIFVENGSPDLTYPQIFMPTIYFDSKPILAVDKSDALTVIPFALSKSCYNFHHYLTYDKSSGESWKGYTNIAIDSKYDNTNYKHYLLSTVFPKSGTWFVHMFYKADTSETTGLFRLKIYVENPSLNLLLVQSKIEPLQDIKLNYDNVIKFFDNGKPFSFKFTVLKPSVRLLHHLKSHDGTVAEFCTYLEKEHEFEQTLCTLNVLFPKIGKWTVELFAAKVGCDHYDLVFEINMNVQHPIIGRLFPKLYHAFGEFDCQLLRTDSLIKTNCDIEEFKLPFLAPSNIYFSCTAENQLECKKVSQQTFVHSLTGTREKILHFIFPAIGNWILTLYGKQNEGDLTCLLQVFIHNTALNSNFSFPQVLESFHQPFKLYFDSSDLPLPSIIKIGKYPENLIIRFHSSHEVTFKHYAEVETKERRKSSEDRVSTKRVLTRMMSNARVHELKIEIAKYGRWSVFLFARHGEDDDWTDVMQYDFNAITTRRREL